MKQSRRNNKPMSEEEFIERAMNLSVADQLELILAGYSLARQQFEENIIDLTPIPKQPRLDDTALN